MENVIKEIDNKFCRLLSFLNETTINFEMIAEEVEDDNLRTALFGIASESNQYAHEICSQLKRLHIDYAPPLFLSTTTMLTTNTYPLLTNTKGGEILSICKENEYSLTKIYKDLLKEYFTYPSLKQMMIYQLTRIRSAFDRIRLLNSIRFSNQ